MNWRTVAIFALSRPFLVVAILWIPLGAACAIMVSPLWGMMCALEALRGRRSGWEIFLVLPMVGLSFYAEITGLIDDPFEAIMERFT